MRETLRRTIATIMVVAMSAGLGPVPLGATTPPPTPAPAASVRPTVPTAGPMALPSLDKIPLQFEANVGQAPGDVRYFLRFGQNRLLLTDRDAVFDYRAPKWPAKVTPRTRGRKNPTPMEVSMARMKASHAPAGTDVIRMEMIGGRPTQPVAEEKLPGVVHYYGGRDPKYWHRNVPTYARVRYQNVYPGIDVVYHGAGNVLEHDFVLAPGADPRQIRMAFRGADRQEIAANGDLVVTVNGRRLVQRKPNTFQEVGGVRRPVASRYVLASNGEVRFEVGAYTASLPLVIDPPVPLGSGGLGIPEKAVGDPSGNSYVTGSTATLVPLPDPLPAEGLCGRAFAPQIATDGFVAKLNADNSVAWVAIFGGRVGATHDCSATFGLAIAIDATAGNVVAVGATDSEDLVVSDGTNLPTPAAFQQQLGDDISQTLDPDNPFYLSGGDAFAIKLTAAGAISYATYFGGNLSDFAQAVAIDTAGNAYITGGTASTQFGTAYTSIINTDQAAGGASDIFVAKLGPLGNVMSFMTVQGGTGDDAGIGIAINAQNEVIVTGDTTSDPIVIPPETEPVTQRDLALDSMFAAAEVPVALRHAGTEAGFQVQTGPVACGLEPEPLYFTPSFPNASLAMAGANIGTGCDYSNGVIAKFTATGGVPTVAYLVGDGGALDGEDTMRGVALDATGAIYVTGQTNSAGFPKKNEITKALQTDPGGKFDAFVVKLALPVFTAAPPTPPAPTVSLSSTLGGAEDESPTGIAVTPQGEIFLSGITRSTLTEVLPPATTSEETGLVEATAYLLRIPPPTTVDGASVVTESDQTVLGTVNEDVFPPPALTISSDVDGNIVIAGAPATGDFAGSIGAKIVKTYVAVVDVKPGTTKNHVNLRTKKMQVAIRSTAEFDMSGRIDLTTILFGKTGLEASVVMKTDKKAAAPVPDCKEFGRKRYESDLKHAAKNSKHEIRFPYTVCKVLVAATGLAVGDTLGQLTAKSKAGAEISGSDVVVVSAPKKGEKDKDHDGDDNDWSDED